MRIRVLLQDTKGAFAPCKVILKVPYLKTGSRTGFNARSGKHKNASKRRTPTR